MSKTITIALLCLLTVFCSALPVCASSLQSLIYVTENFEPYNYVENGAIKGLAVELLRLTWQQAGIKQQKINMYPWARGYLMLQQQDNVVLFTTARTYERESLFNWAGPITTRGQRCVLVALKERGLHINTIEDARHYRIGTIREDYAEQVILKMGISRSSIQSASNMMSNLQKMKANRIDLIAYTEKSIFQILETLGFSPGEFESVYLITEVLPHYAFNKAIPQHLIEQFQKALDSVKQAPGYPELLKKYGLE